VTHLRQAMLEELQRRNYAKTTVQYDIRAIERFAKYFHRPPDQLNQTHLREYQAYLLRDRKLEPRTVKLHVSALRFFFVKTLRRPYLLDDIPYPKVPRRLPTIQLLLGHVKLEHTVIYLHLSRRHLHAVANPLDAMAVSAPDTARRSRRLQKR
jgi:site-specific recombinase XerD